MSTSTHARTLKGKLHSKIISSDMKDFFPQNPMVKVRGRNSNRKTVKQTVKNGRKISGDDAARPAWVTDARRQQFAAASRFWSIPNLMPRSTVTRVWLTEWAHLGQNCGTLTSDNFFFLSFRERCLTRQWQNTECDTRYMVEQRKKFDVILRFLVDRYRRTKPPKPDASQFVVPARLPKPPVIGSGGLSSSRFDDDVPEVNCTWTASFSWRVKEAALWFESHGSKIWQEGQHDHSPPQPINWREHTIGAVHDRNLPARSLQVPESYENFLWHRVKVRSIMTGLRRDDEWDDDRSHRRVRIMSSLDTGWFRLITNILIQSCDLAMIARWHQCGTMTSQMLARASFSAVCLTVFPFEFRPRTFFSPSDSTEKTLSYQSLLGNASIVGRALDGTLRFRRWKRSRALSRRCHRSLATCQAMHGDAVKARPGREKTKWRYRPGLY